MASIDSAIGKLRKDFKKIEAELAINSTVNSKLKKRVVPLKRQCWINSQYSRSECQEISGFSESLKNEDLEATVVKVFEEKNAVVDPTNVEDCHWIGSRTSKKLIIKLSRRKDANKTRRLKKNLNLSSL